MTEFFQNWISDPNFWVMISSVLCFGFIAMKAAKPIAAALDNRSQLIVSRLAEAEALRNEAAAILEDYKKKANSAIQEADSIMLNAERRADQMRQQLENELKETITRHEQNARNRIARLEEETMQTVKAAIISEVMAQVKTQVANDSTAPVSIDHALGDLKKILQK